MPKRGNAARQDSGQGFAFKKDIKDNIGLMLDKQSEGGVSGKLRRYQWSGKTSAGGNSPAQPPIADIYDAKKQRRGGAGLWRRGKKKQAQGLSANWPPGRGGDTRVSIPLTKKGMTMYRRRRKKLDPKGVTPQSKAMSGAEYHMALSGDKAEHVAQYGDTSKKRGGMYRRRRKSRKHAKRKGRQPMPGGGMPQGFGQGAQYGAPPMSMLGNLGGTGGM